MKVKFKLRHILIIVFCALLQNFLLISTFIERKADEYISKSNSILALSKGFIVDENENLYIHNGFYDKIQVYDKLGRFKFSIVPGINGGFTFGFNDRGNIVVTSGKGSNIRIFNVEGELIESYLDKSQETYDEYDKKLKKIFYIGDNIYTMKKNWGYISILNEKGDVKTEITIMSTKQYIIKISFISFEIIMVCLIIYVVFDVTNIIKKNKNK